jgi:hypothetical protein
VKAADALLITYSATPLPLGGAARRRCAESMSKQGLISSKKLVDVYKSEKRAKNLQKRLAK